MDKHTLQLVKPIYYTYAKMYEELKVQGIKEKCIVCLDEFEETDKNIVRLYKCSDHYFHDICIAHCRQGQPHLKCPICGNIYGIQTGDMPSGTMKIRKINGSLPGIKADYYYKISYIVESVVVNGDEFPGTHRDAFMPADKEGSEMLTLLIWGFQRGLTFRPAVSNTTGLRGSVWNIHHKSDITGTAFSYPDPTYLSRLKEELYARGVSF